MLKFLTCAHMHSVTPEASDHIFFKGGRTGLLQKSIAAVKGARGTGGEAEKPRSRIPGRSREAEKPRSRIPGRSPEAEKPRSRIPGRSREAEKPRSRIPRAKPRSRKAEKPNSRAKPRSREAEFPGRYGVHCIGIHTVHMSKRVMSLVFKVLRNGLHRYTHTAYMSERVMSLVFKALRNGLHRYTHCAHVEMCAVTRVHSATEWTASLYTLHTCRNV